MIVYEVNLNVSNEIFHEYYDWLVEHIKIILEFTGFNKAELAKEKENDDSSTKLTVRYTLNSEQDLENYFNHHAETMREDGVKKFGNKFSATRRVLIDSVQFH